LINKKKLLFIYYVSKMNTLHNIYSYKKYIYSSKFDKFSCTYLMFCNYLLFLYKYIFDYIIFGNSNVPKKEQPLYYSDEF
jgi:hypothetical protein